MSKFSDDIEQVAQHPTVRDHARLQSAKDSQAERAKWTLEDPASWDIGALSERDALVEACRCLKCADAPCSKGCPCHIDLKAFMYAVSKEDYYAGAKIMYSDNPLAITCGYLCSARAQCRSGCNLHRTHEDTIDIPALQRFACEQFAHMRIPQIRDPALPPADKLPASYAAPIALVGAGPASLSCAAYLSRLGYSSVTIHEREAFAGGVVAREIPEFRIPLSALQTDIDGITALGGITIKYNSPVASVDALAKENAAVFLGVGLPDPITLPVFDGAPANVTTARAFLSEYAIARRPLAGATGDKPNVSGRVVILGGGDVAFDCAAAALDCGAERVTLAFRENWAEIPAHWEEIVVGIREKLDFVTNASPAELVTAGGKATGVVCNLASWDKAQNLYPEGAQITLQGDHVIVAFGARAGDGSYLAPVALNTRGFIDVDAHNATGVPGVFAGGDCTALSKSIVEGVNDGKTAAWWIHEHVQRTRGEGLADATPRLPKFFTEADTIDLGVDVMGIHFPNPFGLSSASPVTSVGMIKRAFDAGFGFAVTKTMLLDQYVSTNVSPRIARSSSDVRRGPHQVGFINIELLTEKMPKYWVDGIKNLKEEYPDRIIICSVMAQHNKDEWQAVCKLAELSGADAIELNVSCPHVGKKGMGSLAGQNPDTVKEITAWAKEAVKIPIITKMTPNITDVSLAAEAAVEGGADAVSAINTVSGIVTVRRDGTIWPAVGKGKKTAYGGVSGNMVRPIGLKAVSAIRARESTKDTPILGIGGIDSADSAIQFLLAGADVVQMTSSIQNQDYTIVDEMVQGLKAHLYFKSRPDLADNLSQFMAGPAAGAAAGPAPTVASEQGRAVKRISIVPELELEYQVIAQVDNDACLRCGKCYMSCNDTGYQAIRFDAETHLPIITDKCMGCGLCASVCPGNCITYVRKPYKHRPDRGIPNKDVALPFDDE